MKVRRIFLDADEVVEVCNAYGHSLIKAEARFAGIHPVALVYPQPQVEVRMAPSAATAGLSAQPNHEAETQYHITSEHQGDSND